MRQQHLLKAMDSVIIDKGLGVDGAFRLILTHYCPPPATVVDLMSGPKYFYRTLQSSCLSPMESNGYEFIFGDIDTLPRNHLIADVQHAPIRDSCADVAIFDPPYGTSPSSRVAKRRLRYGDIAQEALERMVTRANEELFRALKPKGAVIVKIMDRRYQGTFYPNHMLVRDKFTNFLLEDTVIYRPVVTRKFRQSTRWAANTHSYFLIFRKREAEG